MNSMGAFFSGTDDADDKKGCWFAGVAGHLDKDTCQVKFRFTNFGEFRDMTLDAIFEPDPVTGTGLVVYPEVNAEWMAKVKGHTYTTYTGGSNGRRTPPQTPSWMRGGENDVENRLGTLYGDMSDEDWWAGYGLSERDDLPGNWQGDVRSMVPARTPATSVHQQRLSKRERKRQQREEEARRRGITVVGGNGGNIDHFGIVANDALQALEDLDFPVCKKHFREIANKLVERVSAGISDMQSEDASFLVELTQIFADAFSEMQGQDDISGYEIPYIVSCLQYHSDLDGLETIFQGLMDFMESTYKDSTQIDMIIEYLQTNDNLLTPEQMNDLRGITEDVKVLDKSTHH